MICPKGRGRAVPPLLAPSEGFLMAKRPNDNIIAKSGQGIKNHRQINAMRLVCPPWCHFEIGLAKKPYKVLAGWRRARWSSYDYRMTNSKKQLGPAMFERAPLHGG